VPPVRRVQSGPALRPRAVLVRTSRRAPGRGSSRVNSPTRCAQYWTLLVLKVPVARGLLWGQCAAGPPRTGPEPLADHFVMAGWRVVPESRMAAFTATRLFVASLRAEGQSRLNLRPRAAIVPPVRRPKNSQPGGHPSPACRDAPACTRCPPSAVRPLGDRPPWPSGFGHARLSSTPSPPVLDTGHGGHGVRRAARADVLELHRWGP